MFFRDSNEKSDRLVDCLRIAKHPANVRFQVYIDATGINTA
uniref:Transposase n=1 Tax=Candidatus Kentrum sp. SD TaxID=2126332 RepID=A0A451BLS3_9GAMM|nr:MAG: hypothetical protein BECKSD772D_GA0070982_104120 [Candidatus Kentron sp. SD]